MAVGRGSSGSGWCGDVGSFVLLDVQRRSIGTHDSDLVVRSRDGGMEKVEFVGWYEAFDMGVGSLPSFLLFSFLFCWLWIESAPFAHCGCKIAVRLHDVRKYGKNVTSIFLLFL